MLDEAYCKAARHAWHELVKRTSDRLDFGDAYCCASNGILLLSPDKAVEEDEFRLAQLDSLFWSLVNTQQ